VSELRVKSAVSLKWLAIGNVASFSLNFIVMVLLARLLGPEPLGLIGLTNLILSIVIVLTELGMGAAVIQSMTISDEQLSTLFWLTMIIGASITVLVFVASPLVASLFGQEELEEILSILSCVFLISSIATIKTGLLERNLQFDRLTLATVTSMTVYGVIAVLLALFGLGVWSVVWAILAREITKAITVWFAVDWRPKVRFALHKTYGLIIFGVNVMGGRLVQFLRSNIDYIIIGLLMGTVSFGYYSLAYNLISMPASRLSLLVSQVAFPSFSKLQKDDAKLRNAYLKMTHYLSILIFPALVGLAITAPWLIPTVFGEEWQPAVILVQLMCVAGALKGVATPVIAVINSKGYPAISFFWNLLVLSIATLLMLFLARYGVIGIALATTIVTLINFPLIQGIAGRLIGLQRGSYLATLRPAIIASAMVGGVVGLVTYSLQTSNVLSNDLAILTIQVSVALVTWFGTLLGFDRPAVQELVALFWISLRGVPARQ